MKELERAIKYMEVKAKELEEDLEKGWTFEKTLLKNIKVILEHFDREKKMMDAGVKGKVKK